MKEYPNMVQRLEYFSSWHRAKEAMVICLRYRRVLLKRVRKRKKMNDLTNTEKARDDIPGQVISVSEMKVAEMEIIKFVQNYEFENELKTMKGETDGPSGT